MNKIGEFITTMLVVGMVTAFAILVIEGLK